MVRWVFRGLSLFSAGGRTAAGGGVEDLGCLGWLLYLLLQCHEAHIWLGKAPSRGRVWSVF